MKIAVCVSGVCRGDVDENIQKMKYHFPYDYFFGTWEEQKSNFKNTLPSTPCYTFPEPQMHYHPIFDVHPPLGNKNQQLIKQRVDRVASKCKKHSHLREKYLHKTKQILGHAYLLSQIPSTYDMIIRTRFDAQLSQKVDFSHYLNKAYNERRAIGFGIFPATGYREKVDMFKEDPNYKGFLMDFLIMHRRDMFDVGYAHQLHNEKKLHIAEIGWYQILSEPFDDNHLCVCGGVILNR